MGSLIKQIIDIVNLKPLEGDRSQLTLITGAIFNILVRLHWVSLSESDIKSINEFLTWAFTYFMAHKISNVIKVIK